MNQTLLSLFLLSGVAAEAAELSALEQCRQITEASARLACYDAIVVSTASATSSPASASAPTATVATVANVAPVSSNGKRQQSAEEFGLEHQAADAQLGAIVSRIPGDFRGWEAKTKITLENGQVWQVADGSRGVYQLTDPAVTVERGAFGTFFLRIEGANRAPKVKRLK